MVTERPAATTYVMECTYDIHDPKAFDQYAGSHAFEGKNVAGGSWLVYSDSLDYLMTYAETLALKWALDRQESHRNNQPFAVGRWELRRLGLPILALEASGTWRAVGDDYMDPWPEEHVSDTQLANLPNENTPPDGVAPEWSGMDDFAGEDYPDWRAWPG